MFKRVISITLAGAMLASAAVFAKDTQSEKAKSCKDIMTVTEVGSDYIVAATEEKREISLNINDDTVLIDSESAQAVGIDDIKKGDEILGEYSQAMTKSIPPQANAYLVATNVKNGGAVNLIYADSVEADTEGNIFVTDNERNIILQVVKEAKVTPYRTKNIVKIEDIKKDTELLAWYDIVGLSLPARASTDKVVLISGGEEIASDENKPSEWAEEEIEKAESIGMSEGMNVIWKDNINRLKFCELAYNMLNKSGFIGTSGRKSAVFQDTDNEKIKFLANMGIVSGKEEGIFAPDDLLTREEAAAVICRIVDKTETLNTVGGSADGLYKDDRDISKWAKDAVYKLGNLKIMQGVSDKGFAPKANLTAEQAAATLLRLYNIMDKEESFADSMYNKMSKEENYMFSPISVKMALAMAANGADGDTQKEILNFLGINDLEKYNESAKSMIEKYSKSDALKLNISNSVWINTDKTKKNFSKKYTDTLSDVFSATADKVTDKDAEKKINSWVNEKTSGKIPTIIGESNSDFEAMLINAVYFKGTWANKFEKAATEKDDFTDKDGKKTSIDFMNNTAWVNFGEQDGVKIAELPYKVESGESKDMNVSMFLMMSDKEFNPEKTLNSAKLSSQYTALSMPKFKIEYSAGLNDMLKELGVNKAFTEAAEFEKMFDEGNMSITDVLHKTYIDVDEDGTEAAAVTSIGLATTALLPQPTELKFDKPFTFVIRDNTNGEILFMGEYAFAK